MSESAVTELLLTDGRHVSVRPIRADDAERLVDFHEHLSPESVRFRFFTAHAHLTPHEVARFTQVDGDERLALVAVAAGEIVGVGRYEGLAGEGGDEDEVEVAFVVRDDFQQVGLGSHLVALVAAAAAAHGKARLRADVLPGNTRMLRALRHLGEVTIVPLGAGVLRAVVPTPGVLPRR